MARTATPSADELAARIGPRLVVARDAIGPRLVDARDAIGPRVEDVRDALGPRIEEVWEALAPRVEEVRDLLTEQVAPAVSAALTAAAGTAAAKAVELRDAITPVLEDALERTGPAREEALERTEAALAALRGEKVQQRSRWPLALGFFGLGVGLGAAAGIVGRRGGQSSEVPYPAPVPPVPVAEQTGGTPEPGEGPVDGV